jgi:hypothetical protein
MHINSCSFQHAKAFLVNGYGKEQTLGAVYVKEKKEIQKVKGIEFAPPMQVDENWQAVNNYLKKERRLSTKTIKNLIENDRLYPDIHKNCCFVYGNTKSPVGVERRGTGKIKPGQKAFKGFLGKKGGFWLEDNDRKGKKKWAICESAIEAASYIELYPDRIAWSLSGSANKDLMAAIIKNAIQKNIELIIATNNDEAGKRAAQRLVADCVAAGHSATIELPWGDNNDWNTNLIAIKTELENSGVELSTEKVSKSHAILIAEYKRPSMQPVNHSSPSSS